MKCILFFFNVNLILLLSCTMGERNNPFDPVNPDYDAPEIIVQVKDQNIPVGQPVRFEIFATGTDSLKYQWSKDGKDLSLGTSSTYCINSVTASHEGYYSCKVTNLKGSATSKAKLTVIK